MLNRFVAVLLLCTVSACSTFQAGSQKLVDTAKDAVTDADERFADIYTKSALAAKVMAKSLEEYEALMDPWNSAQDAFSSARASIAVVQATLDVWGEGGDPEPFVFAVKEAYKALDRLYTGLKGMQLPDIASIIGHALDRVRVLLKSMVE